MTTTPDYARLSRPIVGIENRTAQEVFDIMSDRMRTLLERNAELERLAEDRREMSLEWKNACEAAEALVKELERERDEVRESVKRHRKWLGDAQHRAGEMLGRAKKAETKLAEAMKVIKPFAEFFDKAMEGFTEGYADRQPGDKVAIGWNAADLTMSHLRAARDFMKEDGGQNAE